MAKLADVPSQPPQRGGVTQESLFGGLGLIQKDDEQRRALLQL